MNNKRIILILLILVLVLTSLGFGYHTYSKIRSDDNNLKSTQIIKAQSKRLLTRMAFKLLSKATLSTSILHKDKSAS